MQGLGAFAAAFANLKVMIETESFRTAQDDLSWQFVIGFDVLFWLNSAPRVELGWLVRSRLLMIFHQSIPNVLVHGSLASAV